MTTKRWVITGGSGFIGSALLRRLAEEDLSLLNLVHRKRSGIPGVEEREWPEDREDLARLIQGSQGVVHLAAVLGGKSTSPDTFDRANIGLTERILEASQDAGIQRFIFISSCGVYGSLPPESHPVDESTVPAPLDFYEVSKSRAEARVAASSLPWAIVRPGWVYGPGDLRTLKLFRKIARGPFFVTGNARVRQSPVYIDDLVDGLLRLMTAETFPQGMTIHLAGEKPVPAKEICRTIAKALGRRRPLSFPLSPLRMAAAVGECLLGPLSVQPPLTRSQLAFFTRNKPLSIEKANRLLGYTPSVSFEEGIRRTVADYRSRGWL